MPSTVRGGSRYPFRLLDLRCRARTGPESRGPDERQGLAWKRSPREIAAEDDQVGLGELELRQHGLERGSVSVDVGKRGDPASGNSLVALSHKAPSFRYLGSAQGRNPLERGFRPRVNP